MKKLLVLTFLFNMLLFGVIGVMAAGTTNTTTINANVLDPVITAVITDVIDFGNVVHGGTYTKTNSIFITPDSSQMSIQVTISNVSGAGTLFNGLKIDGVSPISHTAWKFICTTNIEGICTWDIPNAYATPSLIVPLDAILGSNTVTITYKVEQAM